MPTLYKLFGWNSGNKYKIIGNAQSKNGTTIIIFNTADAFVMSDRTPVYPSSWEHGFGNEYYNCMALSEDAIPPTEDWGMEKTNKILNEGADNITSMEAAAENIKNILGEIGANDND